MSTFSLLSTAYSGLAAARAALEVTGQNVSNVNTAGYTRQRADQVALAGTATTVSGTTGLDVGQGVQVTGISRIADALVDARVRDTTSSGSYWTAASSALSTVEDSLGEPGDTGLSTALTDFWSAWQVMGNNAGGDSAASSAQALLGTAGTLTARIASGYQAAASAWTSARSAAQGTVDAVNAAAQQVATLNQQIQRTAASGGTANDLMDQRDTALTSLAGLAGTTTRTNADGTVDVLLGGRTLVTGSTARTLQLTGSAAQPFTAPGLQLADGTAMTAEGGTLAAQVASLGPDGAYGQAASAYDAVAAQLAQQVNGVAQQAAGTGATAGSTDFFALDASRPAALGLSVVPTSASGIPVGRAGAGAYDGSVADAIAQLGTASSSPDAAWSAYVSGVGTQSKAAATQASVATSAQTAATTAQTSESGVDLDEETANLVLFQHAYQGAARVLTTVDQMLDTLINHTGTVGIS